jgi:hypothetical protein
VRGRWEAVQQLQCRGINAAGFAVRDLNVGTRNRTVVNGHPLRGVTR